MRTSSVPYLAAALAVVTLSALPGASRAADTHSGPTDVERRLREVEDTVGKLKIDSRKLEITEEDRAKQKPAASWQDGFVIQSPDGDFKLKIGGYTHADGRFFASKADQPNVNQFLFRRARVNLEGTVFKFFDFRILPDFASSKLVLQDAYLDARPLPEAKLRIGKFKTPFGLERLQSATSLLFVERALPTNLVPNRDLGVQVHGDLLRGAFSYAVGIFNGVPDGGSADEDVNDEKDFAGRVFAHPFKDSALEPFRGLGLGLAGTYGDERGVLSSPDLPSFKTAAQAKFFSYRADTPATATGTTIAAGKRYRFSPQGYYYWNSLGLLGELVSSTQRVAREGTSARLTNDSWQVAVSYVLTGEKASYKGVTPAQSFDPQSGRWGAFEVAGRYSELEVDGDTFSKGFADPKKSASKAKAWTVGVNWYLNKAVKLVLNYEETAFKSGAAKGDRNTEKLIVSRVQLAL